MRYALALSVLLVACSGPPSKVDADLVGTWELMVPNAQGVARWVWDIRGDGTHGFDAEGPGDVPAHSGTFEAARGRYTLQSTQSTTPSFVWADTGTYTLAQRHTLVATGRLGTGAWHRVRQEQGDSVSHSRRDSSSSDSSGSEPAVLSPPTILSYLKQHPLDAGVLEKPFSAPNTYTVTPKVQDEKDGVIGEVRTDVKGLSTLSSISLRVYRDRRTAEAAYAADAVFDSPMFRMERGEMVSSQSFSLKKWGDGKCLSRDLVGQSSEASVTCYLLAHYPTQESVMIEGRVSDRLKGKSNEASPGTFDHAIELVMAGLKYWQSSYRSMAH